MQIPFDGFNYFTIAWILLAIFIFPIQFFVTAPYGRHYNTKWGKSMSNQWGWVFMEAVSIIVLAIFFFSTAKDKSGMAWFIFLLWSLHYIHRSFIFPFRTYTKGKKIPLGIVFSAIFFNVINAGTNGYYLGYLENYDSNWFFDSRFILGLILFILGAIINIKADTMLIQLRRENHSSYKVPRGWLFEYISCPNHFGEILEWTGFAILCWNLPALGFAVWTAANLIPRAWSHHKWYKQNFIDYPISRKAVIPFVL